MKLPATGKPRDELLADMRGLQVDDANWRAGRMWSLVVLWLGLGPLVVREKIARCPQRPASAGGG